MTKKHTILPKVGEVISSPLYGSGKIRRRYPPIKKKGKQINYNRSTSLEPKHKSKQPIHYPSIAVKKVFLYWCGLGRPFVNHNKTQNYITTDSINYLQKAIKKHSLKNVIKAMELAHEAFNSSWFLYRKQIRRIACRDFIKYRSNQMPHLPRSLRDSGIKSWLEEFLKGEKYIQDNYSFILKDRYPLVTAELQAIYLRNQGDSEVELLPKEVNAIVECSKHVIQFAKANPIDETSVLHAIDRILNNSDKKFELRSISYLNSDLLWYKTLPKALVDFGTFEYKRDITVV